MVVSWVQWVLFCYSFRSLSFFVHLSSFLDFIKHHCPSLAVTLQDIGSSVSRHSASKTHWSQDKFGHFRFAAGPLLPPLGCTGACAKHFFPLSTGHVCEKVREQGTLFDPYGWASFACLKSIAMAIPENRDARLVNKNVAHMLLEHSGHQPFNLLYAPPVPW